MQGEWKSKFQEMIQVCQEELKKTTEIGKKMLSASKANSDLREAYEDLGHFVVTETRKGNLTWDSKEIETYMEKISQKEAELEEIEKEVKKIKVSPAPEDVQSDSTSKSSDS